MKFLRTTFQLLGILVVVSLSACGGGGGGDTSTQNKVSSSTLSGLISTLQSSLHTMDTGFTVVSGSPQFSGTVSGYSYTGDVLGFSFCTPSDLYVAPNIALKSGNTSIYGCDNSLTLDYVSPDSSTVTVTATIPSYYIDFKGTFDGANFDAYLSATNITITINLDTIDNGDGTYKIDTSSPPVTTMTTGTVTVDSDNASVDIAIGIGQFAGIQALIITEIETDIANKIQVLLASSGDFIF